MPRQRSTAPILVVAIIVGILLSPVLEPFLDQWMEANQAPVAESRQNRVSTWDQRAMWY